MKLQAEPALRRSLEACAAELDDLDADWAVAGATAMQFHGYARATRDIDLFIGDDVRADLLARLRVRGLAPRPIFPPHHYRVTPPGVKDPEASIDLLFPALGVESLGLLAAKRRPIGTSSMPVVPLEHLVALKLTTDPAIDPSRHLRDLADLVALRDRGLVDVARVALILDDVGDADARARLRDLMRSGAQKSRLKRTKVAVRKPRGGPR